MRQYVTLRARTVVQQTVKHSRFIATAMPVLDYDDALARVAEIKRQYPDATHNCYALVADENGQQCKYSDDGEPSGTAGTPILEVLRRKGITHALVVVTRYFGGIKLGANGLVGAYTQAAAEALDAADKVRMVYSAYCTVGLDYNLGGKLPAIVQKAGGRVIDTQYAEGVQATVVIAEDGVEALQSALVEYSKGTVCFAVDHYDYWGEV